VTDHSDADEHTETRAEVVVTERLVAGGAALGRRADGRIVLVDGALPQERVVAEVVERSGTLHGTVMRIEQASADRIEPRCRHVDEGCGGCDLAHLDHVALNEAKFGIVRDALVRIGRWSDPVVDPGPPLDPWGFRTSLRVAVHDGRAALRRRSSHDPVDVPDCRIVHPRLAELLTAGEFGTAGEVDLRVGAATGDRLAVVAPTVGDVVLPEDVLVVGVDELGRGRRAWLHEEVAGRRWRISAESFFQTRPDGAAALVDVVAELTADAMTAPEGVLVDAYCGVGLFAGALLDRHPGWRAVAAERGRSSVADARVNLSDLDVRVVGTSIERFRAPRADVVVADPSRRGLGAAGVRALVATGAERFVLVSCDAAAAGRDLALLVRAGYRPVRAVVVDLFPHTHHVEVVTRFDR